MYNKFLAISLSTILGLSQFPVSARTLTNNEQNKTYSDSSNGGHAVYVSKNKVTLTNPTITKTGDSNSEDADFYGNNAGVLAENGANLTIDGGTITTNGKHANAVFSTATININGTKIETKGDNSGGIMTTSGGVMNASNLNIETSGNSSAAIRSDRGGGDVNVSKGTYKTTGTGSPVIYSTADIDVENATLESSGSEAVVIEGGNSVSLKNCNVTGNNTKLNGQAKNYDTIFIYQSMSGDASEGKSEFSSEGGSITSQNGDTFYVTNTTTTIDLTNTKINNAKNGNFLVAESATWGNSGSNGGNVTLNASKENLNGNIKTDDISSVCLNLKDATSYKGAINPDENKGTVSVSISDDSIWTLTDNSYVQSLDCDEDAIKLNGHKLYVNGKLYKSGTSSKASISNEEINKSVQSEQTSKNEMQKDFILGNVSKIDGTKLTVQIRNGEKEEEKTYDISSATITKGNHGGFGDRPQKPDVKDNKSDSDRPEPPENRSSEKNESFKNSHPNDMPPKEQMKDSKATIDNIKVGSMVELKFDGDEVSEVRINEEKSSTNTNATQSVMNFIKKAIQKITGK